MFSDKISQGKYNSFEQYGKDILKYFVDTLSCFGGLLVSDFCNNPIDYLKSQENVYAKNMKGIVKFFIEEIEIKSYPKTQEIYTLPNFNDPVVFQIPIGISKPFAVLYLFSDEEELFWYYNSIIKGVEDIKLDNDFENLNRILSANS